MEEVPRPTTRGLFVRTHIAALGRTRGRDGLIELHRRFGRPINYAATEQVHVRAEVQILEHIVDMLAGKTLTDEERALEAGRLHFRDFTTTRLWRLLNPIFRLSPKFVLMHSRVIAGYVFRHVQFVSEDLGEKMVRITMFNNDYPLEHFKGFFEEWMALGGLTARVTAAAHTRGRYEYTISWE